MSQRDKKADDQYQKYKILFFLFQFLAITFTQDIFVIILAFISIFLYYRLRKDPGYVDIQKYYTYQYSLSEHQESNDYEQINYCKQCKIMQPLRAKHCKICNLCVHKLDHHCPWIGSCVGELNQGEYLIFNIIHSLLSIKSYICIQPLIKTQNLYAILALIFILSFLFTVIKFNQGIFELFTFLFNIYKQNQQ